MTGDVELETRAERLMETFYGEVVRQPRAYTQFLSAVDFLLGPTQEIVISGDPENETCRQMIQVVHERFRPKTVVLNRPDGAAGDKVAALAPYLKEMSLVDDRPAAYVCEKLACQAPIVEVDQLEAKLNAG